MLRVPVKTVAKVPEAPILDEKVERELLEILEDPQAGAKWAEPETAHWFYEIPYPGVRYYRYPRES